MADAGAAGRCGGDDAVRVRDEARGDGDTDPAAGAKLARVVDRPEAVEPGDRSTATKMLRERDLPVTVPVKGTFVK